MLASEDGAAQTCCHTHGTRMDDHNGNLEYSIQYRGWMAHMFYNILYKYHILPTTAHKLRVRTSRIEICAPKTSLLLFFSDTSGSSPGLQFTIASLDHTVLVLPSTGTSSGGTLGLLRIPAQGAQALRQNGMREVVRAVHPVGVHGREVLHLQLDQGAREVARVAELLGELVYEHVLVNEHVDSPVQKDPKDLPAWYSKRRLKIFMPSFTSMSMGASASLNKIKPIIMGISRRKPNAEYSDLLVTKAEKRAKM